MDEMGRYPLEPLADAMGITVHKACTRLRVTGATYQEYRDRGLTPMVADRLAIKAGFHPGLIWPQWVTDALTVVDEMFLAGGWRQAWLWQEQSRGAA